MAKRRGNGAELRAAIQELARRGDTRLEDHYRSVAEMLVGGDLFAEQRAFVEDPKRTKAALCGRRAGKTKAALNLLLYVALTKPNSNCLYINTSRAECEEIIWLGTRNKGLLTLNDELKLGGRPNRTKLTMSFPNGSRILLKGVDDMHQADKLRGQTYDLVVIDEAGKMAHLEYMIREVLRWAASDYRGTMVLIGTPNPACKGYFFDVTNEAKPAPNWSVHRWTAKQNAKMPNLWLDILADKEADRLADNDPRWLREGLGQWAASTSDFVFDIHLLPELPQDKEGNYLPQFEYHLEHRQRYYSGILPSGHEWRHVIGVDLGQNPSPFAYTVWAYSGTHPFAFERCSEKRIDLNTAQQATILRGLMDAYPRAAIVADAGALGKQIVLDFSTIYHLPVRAAQKHKKQANIAQLNTDLRNGRLRFLRGSALVEEMFNLQWDEKALLRGEFKERRGDPNHLCDAAQYSWRHLNHHLWQRSDEPIEVGSAAYWDARQKHYLEKLSRRMRGAPVSPYDLYRK